MDQERSYLIEALALVDIDPTLSCFSSEQQKWLTGLQITTQAPRDRSTKHIALVPGVFLLLSFCENNKDPIYEIDFCSKPGPDFTPLKTSEQLHNSLGAYLCFKTEPNLTSGPICDVHMLTIERKSRFGENKEVLNVPQGYKIISHQLPFGYLICRKVKSKVEQTFKAVLSEKYCTKKAERINLTHLPLFCFPEGIKIVREIRGFATFSFIFTLADAEKVYISCLIFKENLNEKQREKLEVYNGEQFFYEKALCLVSNTRYTDQFSDCLQHLYRLSLSKSDIPFWKVAQSFANNLLMPPREQLGLLGLNYCYNGNSIKFPTTVSYPYISERSLYTIFKFMTVENIVSVFESLLLEKKVLFVSQSKTILGYATEAFLSLLFPFKWEQSLIPILPPALRDYLTAPMPLVAGISPSLVDSSIESDSVIVYLDKNEVLNDEDNPPLPEKLLKQLMKKLEKLQVYDREEVTEFLENPESTYLFKMQEVQDPHFQGHYVRDIFLDFFLTLMRNYRKFWNKPKDRMSHNDSGMEYDSNLPISEVFKNEDFLSDLGMTKIGSFGYKFTETSIFIYFLEKKYNNPLTPEIVFFDECLDRRKSKKDLVFITKIQNEKYEEVGKPDFDPDNPGPFFYHQFPSLLSDNSAIAEEEIELVLESEMEEDEADLISKVDEEFWMNSGFFEAEETEASIHSKMKSLLLNKYKRLFNCDEKQPLSDTIKCFFQIYAKQSLEIDSIFSEWPSLAFDGKITKVEKREYLQMGKKKAGKEFIAVHENEDYQILERQEVRIIFSSAVSVAYKSSAIIIEIHSHRIKNFVNSIIPKQASFVMEFCMKQTQRDMRASTFKKSSYQVWNMETVVQLRDWLESEKEFGTGVSDCA